MKIKFWLKYKEAYLPPRCRKYRYREKEEYVVRTLKEVQKDELIPAFLAENTMVFSYKNKLWKKANERDIQCPKDDQPMTALEAYKDVAEHSSWYFARSWETKKELLSRLSKDLRSKLFVDGELYIQTTEPMYCIYTFGLGHNHGGTSLSIDWGYNPNISKTRYFNALCFEEAQKKALEIALGRGDTESVSYIQNMTPIQVFDPTMVKRNPKKQHTNGDPFLNALEGVISSSGSTGEAGIVAMALTGTMMKGGK